MNIYKKHYSVINLKLEENAVDGNSPGTLFLNPALQRYSHICERDQLSGESKCRTPYEFTYPVIKTSILTTTAIERGKARGSMRHISSQTISKHNFTNKFVLSLNQQCYVSCVLVLQLLNKVCHICTCQRTTVLRESTNKQH